MTSKQAIALAVSGLFLFLASIVPVWIICRYDLEGQYQGVHSWLMGATGIMVGLGIVALFGSTYFFVDPKEATP